jgi:hypothetical protein
MFDNDSNNESLEETVRSIARELGRSMQRMSQVDVEGIADAVGVDPLTAQQWVDSAAGWMRIQVERLGEDVASRVAGSEQVADNEDPLRGAAPHPLDVPTEEQGLALAALDSGRWMVEPGSKTLTAHGDGPGPSDALGLVRELRVRDWITGDGELTLVGRDALSRWLESTAHR